MSETETKCTFSRTNCDSRNHHGIYSLLHDVMTDGITPGQYGSPGNFPNGRVLREGVDMTLRAVPGSDTKYTETAIGRHEGFSDTLIRLYVHL